MQLAALNPVAAWIWALAFYGAWAVAITRIVRYHSPYLPHPRRWKAFWVAVVILGCLPAGPQPIPLGAFIAIWRTRHRPPPSDQIDLADGTASPGHHSP